MHAAGTYTEIVKVYPDHYNKKTAPCRKNRQLADSAKSAIQEEAGKSRPYKSHDGVAGPAAAAKPDSGEYGGKKEKADITADGSAGDDAPLPRKSFYG